MRPNAWKWHGVSHICIPKGEHLYILIQNHKGSEEPSGKPVPACPLFVYDPSKERVLRVNTTLVLRGNGKLANVQKS